MKNRLFYIYSLYLMLTLFNWCNLNNFVDGMDACITNQIWLIHVGMAIGIYRHTLRGFAEHLAIRREFLAWNT